MKQLETYTKKPYPEYKPADEGDYQTNKGVLHYDSEFDEWTDETEDSINVTPVNVMDYAGITYFFEPSPMEVNWKSCKELPIKDASESNNMSVRVTLRTSIDNFVISRYSFDKNEWLNCAGTKYIGLGFKPTDYEDCVWKYIDVQPMEVKDAEAYIKQKESLDYKSSYRRDEVIKLLTEYLQRQGQKTNQTKL